MALDQKQTILLALSGASAYFGHEWAHQYHGSTAITAVTYTLGALGIVGILLNEFVLNGGTLDDLGEFFDMIPDEAYILSAIGGGAFSLAHEATHGELLLDTSLAQSSFYLAGATLVGFYIHEYARGRLED
jgi:hypothetical protein